MYILELPCCVQLWGSQRKIKATKGSKDLVLGLKSGGWINGDNSWSVCLPREWRSESSPDLFCSQWLDLTDEPSTGFKRISLCKKLIIFAFHKHKNKVHSEMQRKTEITKQVMLWCYERKKSSQDLLTLLLELITLEPHNRNPNTPFKRLLLLFLEQSLPLDPPLMPTYTFHVETPLIFHFIYTPEML